MDNAHEGMVWSLAWHPLGHILCSGSNDHTSKFWTRNRPGDRLKDRYNTGYEDGDIGTVQQAGRQAGIQTDGQTDRQIFLLSKTFYM